MYFIEEACCWGGPGHDTSRARMPWGTWVTTACGARPPFRTLMEKYQLGSGWTHTHRTHRHTERSAISRQTVRHRPRLWTMLASRHRHVIKLSKFQFVQHKECSIIRWDGAHHHIISYHAVSMLSCHVSVASVTTATLRPPNRAQAWAPQKQAARPARVQRLAASRQRCQPVHPQICAERWRARGRARNLVCGRRVLLPFPSAPAATSADRPCIWHMWRMTA